MLGKLVFRPIWFLKNPATVRLAKYSLECSKFSVEHPHSVLYRGFTNTKGPQKSQQSPEEIGRSTKERVEIVINNTDLEWKYIRGSGPGGQAAQKTSNCVVLTHKPSGISVRAGESRDTDTNKHYAIKKLKERLDVMTNGALSKKQKEIDHIKAQKDRRQRRRTAKLSQQAETPTDSKK